MIPEVITEEFLNNNPEYIFVFGDNTQRQGLGGAAALRHHRQAVGFITKKTPGGEDKDYFTPENYIEVYLREISHLRKRIKDNKDKTYIITPLGAGLANRFKIFEQIIEPTIKSLLSDLNNVEYTW